MTELVEEAIACGEIVADIKATHVAFTLEGIIMFFFLMHSHICELGNFQKTAQSLIICCRRSTPTLHRLAKNKYIPQIKLLSGSFIFVYNFVA